MKLRPAKWLDIAAGVALAGLFVSCGAAQAQQGESVDSLVRQASKECRTAKTMRRSDLDAAQEHFRNYQQLLQRALQIRPDLLDSPGASVERVLNFCDAVKRDLDRAEALPEFEEGLKACAEARVMIANASFDEAEEKYQRYREQKEGALAISESVLDVYENSYEVRLCDQLGEDIAKAREEYQEQLREQAAETRNMFREVVDSLSQARRQCRGAQNLINDSDGYGRQTVEQIQNLSNDSRTTRRNALARRDELLNQGNQIPDEIENRIDSLLSEIENCQGSVSSGLPRVKAAVAQRDKSESEESESDSEKKVNREFRQIVGAPAEYPRRALRRDVEGHVVVHFTITRTGDVDNIEIVEAEPEGYFEDSVREAVGKYKFQPRVRDGKPVATENVERRVVFKLR